MAEFTVKEVTVFRVITFLNKALRNIRHIQHNWQYKSRFFFYSIINHKQILTKYYNHQEHTSCYLGDYKNTMLEQKLMEKITKIKILKEKRKVKR